MDDAIPGYEDENELEQINEEENSGDVEQVAEDLDNI